MDYPQDKNIAGDQQHNADKENAQQRTLAVQLFNLTVFLCQFFNSIFEGKFPRFDLHRHHAEGLGKLGQFRAVLSFIGQQSILFSILILSASYFR